MTVAESLKRFRAEYGLSQKEVADKVGMVPTSYYRYESGRYLPQADIIITLAKAYGVTADYLLGLSDKPKRPDIDSSDFFKQVAMNVNNLQELLSRAEGNYGHLQDNKSA